MKTFQALVKLQKKSLDKAIRHITAAKVIYKLIDNTGCKL